jgi:hypothetical protein
MREIIVIWEEKSKWIDLDFKWDKVLNWYAKYQPSDESCKFPNRIKYYAKEKFYKLRWEYNNNNNNNNNRLEF